MARKLYEARGHGRNLNTDILWYTHHGYVYSDTRCLILADVWRAQQSWHVFLAVGKGAMGKFCELMPHYMPYVTFERNNDGKLKKYPTERFTRLCKSCQTPANLSNYCTATLEEEVRRRLRLHQNLHLSQMQPA